MQYGVDVVDRRRDVEGLGHVTELGSSSGVAGAAPGSASRSSDRLTGTPMSPLPSVGTGMWPLLSRPGGRLMSPVVSRSASLLSASLLSASGSPSSASVSVPPAAASGRAWARAAGGLPDGNNGRTSVAATTSV